LISALLVNRSSSGSSALGFAARTSRRTTAPARAQQRRRVEQERGKPCILAEPEFGSVQEITRKLSTSDRLKRRQRIPDLELGRICKVIRKCALLHDAHTDRITLEDPARKLRVAIKDSDV
jgi:hypothetical protein